MMERKVIVQWLLFKLVWRDPIIHVCVMFWRKLKRERRKRERESQRELVRDKNEKRELEREKKREWYYSPMVKSSDLYAAVQVPFLVSHMFPQSTSRSESWTQRQE